MTDRRCFCWWENILEEVKVVIDLENGNNLTVDLKAYQLGS